MKRILAVAFLLLTVGVARAANPVTIESDWNYDLYFKACTGVTSCVADVAGLGAGVSLSTMNVVGFSWSILSVGATSTFTISQVTRTPPTSSLAATTGANYNGPASSFNDSGHPTLWALTTPTISTTTAITAVSGIPLNGQFQALVVNPYISFSGLNVSATTYIWVELGRRKM